ncbi:MAG: hypothetical protein M1368_01625, partial [Thaumarchaeota archaeon]|nr:hypothetical protein [Nitrososphaerota archaeon]
MKIAVSIVLILVGILLIATFIFAILSFPMTIVTTGSASGSIPSQIIPQNLTVSLMSWHASGGNLQLSWSASGP